MGQTLQEDLLSRIALAVEAGLGGGGGDAPVGASNVVAPLNSAIASATLIAANAARRGLALFNTDENDAYIKYGVTASAASFTDIVRAGSAWQMPLPIYTGRIDVIWAADGGGQMMATELTTA